MQLMELKEKLKEKFINTDEQQKRALLQKGLILLFSIILIVCVFFIARYYLSTGSAAIELENLKEAYVSTAPTAASSTTSADNTAAAESTVEATEPEEHYVTVAGYSVPYRMVDFNALQTNTNPHIYAWITIPDTEIDYPIVQHPTDNTYYLNRKINGGSGLPGSIYSENYNSTDWTDANTILYGHNMKNGTMFAGLHEYEDADYLAEHPYVYIYTDNYVRIYQLFAAYPFTDQHLYTLCDWNDPEAVSAYHSQIFANSGSFDKTVSLESDSKLLTLSTCIRNQDDKRYIVQGVLVAEGNLE